MSTGNTAPGTLPEGRINCKKVWYRKKSLTYECLKGIKRYSANMWISPMSQVQESAAPRGNLLKNILNLSGRNGTNRGIPLKDVSNAGKHCIEGHPI
ncbi:hypothetical protein NRI_0023 [Neorickettsia risticii str. Illinois]|uniref:Uncharacterized protein n=1 Tax=Neorickettsia risticii (strain Illinois) TaxID=434131 RepID=C6V3Q5_NEORI|nr:hypothetical protein NRI_0023 [Neorickettsia risticii str. Illinois]